MTAVASDMSSSAILQAINGISLAALLFLLAERLHATASA